MARVVSFSFAILLIYSSTWTSTAQLISYPNDGNSNTSVSLNQSDNQPKSLTSFGTKPDVTSTAVIASVSVVFVVSIILAITLIVKKCPPSPPACQNLPVFSQTYRRQQLEQAKNLA